MPYVCFNKWEKLLKHKKEVVWITWLQGQAYISYLPVTSCIKKWNTYVAQILFQVKEVKRISNSKCCHLIHCISNMYSQNKENSSFKWRRLREYTLLNGQQCPSKFLLEKKLTFSYMYMYAWDVKKQHKLLWCWAQQKHQIASEGCNMTKKYFIYSQWSRMQCMVLGSGLGYISDSCRCLFKPGLVWTSTCKTW